MEDRESRHSPSTTNEADLNRYLNEIVHYTRAIKHELQQEAVAFEVDQ